MHLKKLNENIFNLYKGSTNASMRKNNKMLIIILFNTINIYMS